MTTPATAADPYSLDREMLRRHAAALSAELHRLRAALDGAAPVVEEILAADASEAGLPVLRGLVGRLGASLADMAAAPAGPLALMSERARLAATRILAAAEAEARSLAAERERVADELRAKEERAAAYRASLDAEDELHRRKLAGEAV